MGYFVKRVTRKSGPEWKLQFITYAKSETGDDADRKIKDVSKSDYAEHGFDPRMSLNEAKSKATALNAQKEIKRWNEAKVKIRERLTKQDQVESAFLPQLFVDEFETKILFEKFSRNDESVRRKNKIDSHWRAAKEIIRVLKVDYPEWQDQAHRFYAHFERKNWSMSYCTKLLRILNAWGFFMSKKTKVAFFPIPSPDRATQGRIQDSFFDSRPSGEGNASHPLTPSMLEAQKNNLKPEHYAWLFISVWFGLRPHEIDGLKQAKTWKIVEAKGRTDLHVYQPKLIKLARSKRWKVIPVKFKEQRKALEMIEAGLFSRPILKVVHRWFGERVTPYAGRKGFTDLMLSKGERFEFISMWMGHTTLDRTYRDYKDKLRTSYDAA